MSKRRRNAYCSFCRKSYEDVGPLVEGPGDVYICAECIELCQSIIAQEKRRRGTDPLKRELPTAVEIQRFLDPLFAGQEAATSAVWTAAHSHYKRLLDPSSSRSARTPKNAWLVVGPTQSSKILLARSLAHIFDVPFAYGRVATLLKPDPTNLASNALLSKLLNSAEFDSTAASRGIIYVDGIDDPRSQASVLSVMDGMASKSFLYGRAFETASVLLFCGGVFAGLEDVRVHRGRRREQPITEADLVAWGMHRDLASRLELIVEIGPLDDSAFVRLVSSADLRSLGKDNSLCD